MNKQELIEKIEDLKENLEGYQSIAYLDIADDIRGESKEHNSIAAVLEEADAYLDDCLEKLEEALEMANDLPEYEYKTTYAEMTKHIPNKILFNRIGEIDEEFTGEPIRMSENGEPTREIFQYFLTDCTESDVEWLCENYEGVYFAYSEKLELWVLMVDHYGSSWDIVYIGTHNEYDKIEE